MFAECDSSKQGPERVGLSDGVLPMHAKRRSYYAIALAILFSAIAMIAWNTVYTRPKTTVLKQDELRLRSAVQRLVDSVASHVEDLNANSDGRRVASISDAEWKTLFRDHIASDYFSDRARGATVYCARNCESWKSLAAQKRPVVILRSRGIQTGEWLILAVPVDYSESLLIRNDALGEYLRTGDYLQLGP